MEKYRGDQLSDSNRFISFLKYTHNANNERRQLLSPACGFGWMVMMYAGSGGSPLEFRFHPNTLANASLGSVNVQMTVVFKLKESESVEAKRYSIAQNFSFPLSNTNYYDGIFNGYYTDSSRLLATYSPPQPSLYVAFIQLSVTVGTVNLSPAGPRIQENTETRINKMLSSMLTGTELTDTKFCLLSRTSTVTGQPYGPRSLFANSELLRGRSEVLDELLFGDNYQESEAVDLDSSDSGRQNLNAGEYDFPEDSDLEDDDYEPEAEEDRKEKGKSTVVQAAFQSFSASDPSPSGSGTSPSVAPEGSTITTETKNEVVKVTQRFGRVVTINGHAYRTWHAFLFYLMTGEIHFLPLTSSHKRAAAQERCTEKGIIACSPKSMYHLGQKYEVPVLSELALEEVGRGLNQENAVHEAFERMTSLYPQLNQLVAGYIASNMTSQVALKLDKAIRNVVDERNADAVSLIIQKLHGTAIGEETGSASNYVGDPFSPATSGSGKKKKKGKHLSGLQGR